MNCLLSVSLGLLFALWVGWLVWVVGLGLLVFDFVFVDLFVSDGLVYGCLADLIASLVTGLLMITWLIGVGCFAGLLVYVVCLLSCGCSLSVWLFNCFV